VSNPATAETWQIPPPICPDPMTATVETLWLVGAPEGTGAGDPARDAVERCRASALRLLKARDRTPVALARRLRLKGFEEPVVAHVVARLEDVGLLDERATAERLVRTELRKAAAAERLLRSRLFAEGVSDAIASEVIADALAEVDPAESAEAEARRWLERRADMDPDAVRRRLAGRLARRGFGHGVVREVLARVLPSIPPPPIAMLRDGTRYGAGYRSTMTTLPKDAPQAPPLSFAPDERGGSATMAVALSPRR
jgi:regulatory protein